MSDKKSTASSGIGLFGLLTVAFIALKLCKVIGWSWGWVLAPLWIPAALVTGVIVVVIITKGT